MLQSFLKGEGVISTRRVWLMALFVLGCLLPSQVEATHYRYSTLNWRPTTNTNEVEIKFKAAFRRRRVPDPAFAYS